MHKLVSVFVAVVLNALYARADPRGPLRPRQSGGPMCNSVLFVCPSTDANGFPLYESDSLQGYAYLSCSYGLVATISVCEYDPNTGLLAFTESGSCKGALACGPSCFYTCPATDTNAGSAFQEQSEMYPFSTLSCNYVDGASGVECHYDLANNGNLIAISSGQACEPSAPQTCYTGSKRARNAAYAPRAAARPVKPRGRSREDIEDIRQPW